jgi:hypothetical protein
MTEAQFWSKVDRTGGPDSCWPWTAGLSGNGYGSVGWGHVRQTHRVAYELAVGPIPADMVLDHTCHNADPSCLGGRDCQHRRCVNPAHLEPVTRLVNVQRGRNGNASKTHCVKGHPFDERNTCWRRNGGRVCRKCRNFQSERARQLRRKRASRSVSVNP